MQERYLCKECGTEMEEGGIFDLICPNCGAEAILVPNAYDSGFTLMMADEHPEDGEPFRPDWVE